MIDLSVRLDAGMPESSALPRFARWWYGTRAWSDAAEFQAMLLSEHTGTNVDAPRHVVEGGATLDDLPVDAWSGPALVLDLSEAQPGAAIDAADLELAERASTGQIEQGDIVLIHTGHDERHWRQSPQAYSELARRPALTVGAGQLLLDRGVKALGVDTVSPDLSGSPLPVHRLLLGAGVLIIERLVGLAPIAGERVLFIALPLRIAEGTGSPVRAVAVPGEAVRAWATGVRGEVA